MELLCDSNLLLFILTTFIILGVVFWVVLRKAKYLEGLNKYKKIKGAAQCYGCGGKGEYDVNDFPYPCGDCGGKGYVMIKDHDFLN